VLRLLNNFLFFVAIQRGVGIADRAESPVKRGCYVGKIETLIGYTGKDGTLLDKS
jgi:hypothetical protein